MASNIKFKRSAVQNRVPTTAQLELGELALNTYDGKLYTEKNSGSAAVVEIGSILSSLVVDGDNGGGNGDVTFHGATAGRDLLWDASADSLIAKDNTKIALGDDSDLSIYHNGSHSFLDSSTGILSLRSSNIRLKNADGSKSYIHCTIDAVEIYRNDQLRITTTFDGADIGGTGSLKLPVGTTAQRNSSPTAGDMRYNSTTGSFEGYTTGWGELGGSGIGIGSTSTNPGSGVVNPLVGVGFTTINFVGAGLSVTGYGSTVVVDLGGAVSRKYGRKIHAYTATANQTTFVGLSYTNGAAQISVYLNGAKLSAATYTATSGSTVVLGTGASVGDEIEIICIDSGVDLTRNVTSYTATANQTTFTGLGYSDGGDLDVYLNGIRLAQSDYTANNGTSLVLAAGASVGDLLEVVDMGQGAQWSSGFGADPDDIYRLNGGVGIGTTNPTDKLNIVGNVEVVGILTATHYGDGSNLTNTGSTLSEPSSGTQRLVTTSLTTGTMTSSGTGSELAFDYANNELEFSDSTKALFGTGGDLQIYHDSNNSYIENSTNSLFIRSDSLQLYKKSSSERYIICAADAAVKLFHNDSLKIETTAYGTNTTGTTDTDGLVVSGVSTVAGQTNLHGDVILGNATSDTLTATGRFNTDLVPSTDNARDLGASGLEWKDLYIDGTANIDTLSADSATLGTAIVSDLTDNRVVIAGTSGELEDSGNLTFDGSTLVVTGSATVSSNLTVTGNATIQGVLTYDDVTNIDSVGIVTVRSGGYLDVRTGTSINTNATGGYASGTLHKNTNSGEFAIVSGGTGGANHMTFYTSASAAPTEKLRIESGGHILPGTAGTQDLGSTSKEFRNLYLGDRSSGNGGLTLGSDQDMFVFHDNIHGYVSNRKANLYLEAPTYVMITSTDTNGSAQQTSARFLRGGASDLYHSNTLKFSTSPTGITVTGEVAASQDYPTYRPTIDFNFAAVKKLDSRITYSRTGPASFTDEFGIVVLVGGNVPRFDHDPTTRESKGLLIEESRINRFASSDAAHSVWIKSPSGTTNTGNTTDTKDPAGTYTATKLTSVASANSGSQIYDGMSRSSGGVQSLWAKKGTHNVIGIYDYSGGTGIRGWFDLNTGEHRCEGGSKVAAGVQSNGNDTNTTNMVEYPNGWYRCIYYEAANMTYAHFRICDFDSDTESSSSANSVYLWGLQAEDGGVTFATSHIPCNTGLMPGTVTRGADIVLLDDIENEMGYNQLEGTAIADFSYTQDSDGGQTIFVFSGTESDPDNSSPRSWLRINQSAGTANTLRIYRNSDHNDSSATATAGVFQKVAYAYEAGDADVSLNGTSIIDTSRTPATNIFRLSLGNIGWSLGLETTCLEGHIRRFIYYPKKLPNSQLNTLTS